MAKAPIASAAAEAVSRANFGLCERIAQFVSGLFPIALLERLCHYAPESRSEIWRPYVRTNMVWRMVARAQGK
jgi:hypothetical protein